MSDTLSKECDSLLATTTILDHHYGIPDITKNHLKFTSSSVSLGLESKYHKLYNELSYKLNRLMYLNKLHELNGQSEDIIEQQYQEVIINKLDKLPVHEYSSQSEESRLRTIREFYEFQLYNFKTNILLNEYLQITLPILRSIHQLDTGITTTELNISQNLSMLYSKNEIDSKANINRLIKCYNESNFANKNTDDLISSLSSRLNNELPFKLKDLNILNQDLEKEHNLFLERKEKQIKEYLNENNGEDHKKFLERYNTLINEWSYISIMSEFISGFITSLPIDWYQDKSLRKIVFDTEKISKRVSSFQLVINRNNFGNFNLELLYMIDLDELELDSETSDED